MPKLYRVIEYDGPQDWIDEMVDRSIRGVRKINPLDDTDRRFIRAATINPEDKVSIVFARDKIRNTIASFSVPAGFVHAAPTEKGELLKLISEIQKENESLLETERQAIQD